MLLMLVLLALPERVTLKTPTETFTATHELAVRDGHLWWRRTGERWTLVPPDGLPAPRGRLEALKRVTQLSADGDDLIAIGQDGTVDWVDEWGPSAIAAPLSVNGLDAFAMSHRKIPS